MAESLRGGLSFCLSGFGFWSHDISGFEGTAKADVYKRWAAFGLLSTHSRLHGSNSYRVPWLFSKEGEENGEESVAVVKAFSELKCSLMPYIFSSAVNTHKTGIPTMRAMVLEFTDDICCEDLDKQYMLGDSLMVAPVFREDGNVTYYLPEGEWTHLLSNEVKNGGKWIKENYDFFSLPLFVKENSIIAVGKDNTKPEYDYTDGLTLNIFALKDKAEAVIYDINGEFALKAIAVNENGNITVTLDGKYNDLKICMRNVDTISNINGADCEKGKNGAILNVKQSTVSFTIG
jgi:alpha-D-xyloside xylohydrolase